VLSLILASMRQRKNGEDDSDGDGGSGGEDIDYDHVSEFAPFFEIDAHWSSNSSSLAENVRANHDRLGQRVFNTHLRWEMLPKRSAQELPKNCDGELQQNKPKQLRPACGKFIYVTRNLLDVCASFYHHLSNQKEGTYTKGYDAFARDWMAGNIPFGSPLHHLLSFAEGFGDNHYADDRASPHECDANQQPLLLLNYERMKVNPRKEVLRIIDFLNLSIPMEVLDNELLPSFQFQHMKNNIDKFQPRSVTWLNGYNFLRKGESGDGRALMAESRNQEGEMSLIERFHKWVEEENYVDKIRCCLGPSQAELYRMQIVFDGLILEDDSGPRMGDTPHYEQFVEICRLADEIGTEEANAFIGNILKHTLSKIQKMNEERDAKQSSTNGP